MATRSLPGLLRGRWWWLLVLALPLVLQTRTGIDALVQLVIRASGGTLQLGDWQGEWLGDLRLRDLQIQAGDTRIHVDRLQLRWSPQALWQRRLQLQLLQVGQLTIDSRPSPEPIRLPHDLQLPMTVAIDRFAFDRLVLRPQGVELTALAGDARAADGQYFLRLDQLHSRWGQFAGKAQLAMQAPFALRLEARANLGLQGRALEARLLASGGLEQLQLQANGRSGDVALTASASLRPFADGLPQMLPRASVRANGIDLRQWLADAPASAIDATLDIRPQTGALLLGLQLQNRLPGSLDQGRLPVRAADGEARLSGQRLELRQLDAQLLRGRLAAHGVAENRRLDMQLGLTAVDVSAIWSRLLPSRLDGSLHVSGSPQRPRIAGQIRDPRLAAALDLSFSRLQSAPQVDVHQLDLQARNAEARLSGRVDLAARQRFELAAVLRHFNPAAFGAFPVAELNGSIEARGSLLPSPQAQLLLSIRDSRFNQLPLLATGALQIAGRRVQHADLQLQLGQNHLRLDGTLGLPGDRLRLQVDAPELAAIGPGWHGKAMIDAELAGAYRRPSVQGTATIERLATPFGVAAGQLALQASIPDLVAAPASVRAVMADIVIGEVRLGDATLQLQGTPAQHRLQLEAAGRLQGRASRLQLEAQGGWLDAGGWQGTLAHLSLDGPLPIALQQPASLLVAPGRFSLGGAEFSVAGGQLLLARSEWGAGELRLEGSLVAVELAQLLQLAAPASSLDTDLRVAGNWHLGYRDGWSGTAVLMRAGGDLVVRQGGNGVSGHIPLHLQTVELRLNATPGKWALTGVLQSREFGRADLFGELWPASDSTLLPAAGSPVSAALTLEMPSLTWLGPLLGAQYQLDGRVGSQLALQGVIGNVNWSGAVSGDNVWLRNPDLGMDYRGGSIRAAVVAAGVYVNECRFTGGDGSLSAQGELLFGEQSAAGRMQVVVDRFVAMNRPDLQLTVSGSTDARLADDKFDLSGSLRADNGFFRFSGGGMPALSDDVVIVGRGGGRAGSRQKLPVSILLDLDLGERLRFEGWGIKTGLTGGVRVKSVRGQPLHVSGTVRSTDGRYSAYGQDLKITHGALAFQGPLDNPALDVIAIREHLAVEPGIHLTGSLQSPRLSLIADSDMSEHEKLSWLVLGRPPAESGQQKADADLLIAAASALLSSDQSSSLQQQLAARFGIDEIGLRSRNGENPAAPAGSSGAAAQQVVAIGKRLSDKAYVVYEQGVDAASAAVKLTYRVSRHWSLVAKAGQESQFDVFWNFWFD